MKNYLLFMGYRWYPNGGMLDYINSFDSLNEAENTALAKRKEDLDWFHVFSISDNKIVLTRNFFKTE